jgi:hypothetical protein
MPTVERLKRSVALCGLVCAALMTTSAGAAIAASDPATGPNPYAQERYYSSFGVQDTSAAHAQEQYLQSYGESQPLSAPQSPLASDDTPWLPFALSIAGALIIVAASATQLRRLRIRRRRAAGSAA